MSTRAFLLVIFSALFVSAFVYAISALSPDDVDIEDTTDFVYPVAMVSGSGGSFSN